MFVKVTHSGPRSYVQLVEAYRDDAGRPKQRTVVTLGRLDQLNSGLDSVIAGLLRVTGKPAADARAPTISFESARDFGDVWALTELWNVLGFDRLRRIFGRTRHAIDVESLVRVMVLNRLCDPESKLGVLRWLQTVSLPGPAVASIEHQHLLRAMDALIEHQEEVEVVLASLLRPLIDQDLAIAFYDMTTIRAAGLSQEVGDVRHFGMSKEGVIARQVMLGVVQTAEGLPLYHEVFDGNTAEVQTLRPTLERIVKRFPVKRVIAVADRGLLSLDSLEELKAITLPGGGKLEFILAVPGRRYGEFVAVLEPLQAGQFDKASAEVLGEASWQELRLIVAHDPGVAKQAGAKRDECIDTLQKKAQQLVDKLEAQEASPTGGQRKLSDSGACARFYRDVLDAAMARIIRVDMKSDLFSYHIDDKALAHARLMDGKLLLITNVKDLTPEQVLKRYKSLADIERGFRVLKSEIEIGPIHHRLPDRIRAHATICFIALILYRVMRARLHASGAGHSPERALERLRRIQHHRVTLNASQPMAGLSTIDQEQSEILAALSIKKPTLNSQLTLL